MRWIAANATLAAGGVVAQAMTDPPSWLVLIAFLFGSGFFGRYLLKRLEQDFDRKLQAATTQVQEATAQETHARAEGQLDEIRRAVVTEARETMTRLEGRTHEAEKRASELLVEIETLRRDLADTERRRVEQHQADQMKIRALSEEIERLHDELGAYLAGEQPDKRRRDEPRP